MPEIPIISTSGFPSNVNVVKGIKCVECCATARAKGRLEVLLQVTRLLGDLVRSLNSSVDFLNEKRTFVNTSETPNIAFVRNPEIKTAIPSEQYAIREFPNINQVPKGVEVVSILSLAYVLVGYYQYLDVFTHQIEILTAFQEALNKIPPTVTTATGQQAYPEDCISCCKGYLLSQKHPRKFVREKVRKRL